MRRAGLIALVAGALAVALWGVLADPPDDPGAPAAPDAAAIATPACAVDVAWDLRPGQRYHYDLVLKAETAAALTGAITPGGKALRGTMDLAGRLILTVVEPGDADSAWISARLGALDRADVEILGRVVDAATLTAAEVFFRMDRCGHVPEIRGERAGISAGAEILAGLIRETAFDLTGASGGPTWRREHRSMYGVGPRTYTGDGPGPDDGGVALVASRTSLDATPLLPGGDADGATVRGTWRARFAADHLTRLIGGERVEIVRDGLRVARGVSQLRLTIVGRDVVSEAARLAASGRAEGADAPARAKRSSSAQALNARIADMTWPQLRAELLRYGNAGTMPDHRGWLWRATGLVIRDPDQAASLVGVYEDPSLNSLARGLILDVLAAAGHPQAQAAMREALASEVSEASDAYGALVQRFSLVERPTPDTVDFLSGVFRDAEGEIRRASAGHALGSVAHERHARGDGAGAAAAMAPVVAALSGAPTSAERAAMLGSLGNAGLPDHLSAVTAYLAAPETAVRAAAVSALRKHTGVEAKAAALGLVSDRSATVQRAALQALGGKALSDVDVRELADQVTGGRIDGAAFGALLALMRDQRDTDWSGVIAAIIESGRGPAAVRATATRLAADHGENSQ